MTKVILNWILGGISLCTVSIGGLSLHRMFNPSTIGGQLLKEKYELITEEDVGMWDKLVEEHEKSSSDNQQPAKIEGLKLTEESSQSPNTENEDQKKERKRNMLGKKCMEILLMDQASDKDNKNKEVAKNWCTKQSPVLSRSQKK